MGLLSRYLVDIEVILTANEKEALILENELIKRHQPRFNVNLKDDKTFCIYGSMQPRNGLVLMLSGGLEKMGLTTSGRIIQRVKFVRRSRWLSILNPQL